MKTCDETGAEVRAYGRNRRFRFVSDDAAFPADAYRGRRGGFAWSVLGWEVEPTEDTEWDGIEVRTGRVLAVMVGDDCPQSFDPADLSPIPDESYCAVCGQIGCTHDGRERGDA